MKKRFFLVLPAVMLLWSCGNSSGNMAGMNRMKDSIFSYSTTAAAVTINIQDGKMLIITLGDPTLYAADEATRQQTAADLGAMALRVLGPESGIDKGKLIVTPNETNQEAEPKDGIVTPIDIVALRHAAAH